MCLAYVNRSLNGDWEEFYKDLPCSMSGQVVGDQGSPRRGSKKTNITKSYKGKQVIES